MRIKKGNCMDCGKEGILSARIKRDEYKDAQKLMDCEETLTSMGGGEIRCQPCADKFFEEREV